MAYEQILTAADAYKKTETYSKAEVDALVSGGTGGSSSGSSSGTGTASVTIIPCKIVIGSTMNLVSMNFKSDTYSVIAGVRDGSNPYAVKIKADVYMDMSAQGMGEVFVEYLYLDFSSYNSSTYNSNSIDVVNFSGSTANDGGSYNPMTIVLNIGDTNGGHAVWWHINTSGVSLEGLESLSFNLEV